jgi:E3 ubiquitin-protein ligase NEDD4
LVGSPFLALVSFLFCLTPFIAKVLAANGLVKRDIFSLPNPFAVVTTDGSDLRQTGSVKKTLTPYWNQPFDLLSHPIAVLFLSLS